ncbi:phage baseplate assembly protein V, partial [Aromatoleum toluclasticum]
MDAHLIELARRLDNLIRLGTIHSVDLPNARARVTIGGLTTAWLPWMAERAGTTRQWSAPTVGEQVMVLSPGGDFAAGVILMSAYSTASAAPSNSDTEHLTVYPDGARIAYDHATGALTATGVQTATLQSAGLVTIDAPDTHITGTLTVDQLLT